MNRDVLNVLLITALAQLAAFGKSALIAYYFGVGAMIDGYYLAQALPATLTGVFVGFLQTGFLPLYRAHISRGEKAQASALLARTLALALLVGLSTSLLICAIGPELARLVVTGKNTAAVESAALAVRWLAFLIALNAVVDALGLALNAHNRFALVAAAPIANATVSSAILLAAPEFGLANLIAGTLAGLLVQLAIVGIGSWKCGIHLSVGEADSFRGSLGSGMAILPGLTFSNLAMLIPSLLAAQLGEGAIATLSIASRIHGAAIQVLAIAVSTVLLPHFAGALARRDYSEIVATLATTRRATATVATLAVIWVAAAGNGIVGLVFERGAFDAAASASVSSTWFWLTIGLYPMILSTALAKALQAMQQGHDLSRISTLSFVVLVVAGHVGALAQSVEAIAFSTALSSFAAAVACAIVLRRRLTAQLAYAPPIVSGWGGFVLIAMIGALYLTGLMPRTTSVGELCALSTGVLGLGAVALRILLQSGPRTVR
jgi:putative peptidoglycan lipid II flippase